MLTSLREIVRYRSLLRDLVARDLTVRYKRSVLGVAWTMLNPLLMMLVFTVVFGHILRVPVPNFTVFFLSAFLAWNFFSQATSWATACMMGYAPLMKKIYVPKAIFVLATVLSGLVNLLLSLIPLALIMLAVRQPFTSSLAFLPVAMILTTLFTLGVALLLAPICLMFADVVQIYQAILMAWMYLTPVMYPATMVPERYRGFVDVNPMSYFVEMFRAPIYGGVLPAAQVVLVGSAFGVVSLLVGWVVFERSSDRIAYHL